LDAIVALKRNPQLGTLMILPPSLSMGVYFGMRYAPGDIPASVKF
jgi:hypothetical protein